MDNLATFYPIHKKLARNLCEKSKFRNNLTLARNFKQHNFVIESIIILPGMAAMLQLLLQITRSRGISERSLFIISMLYRVCEKRKIEIFFQEVEAKW